MNSFMELTAVRERQNIQHAALHLMDCLDNFLLECPDDIMKQRLTRERQILQNHIIQLYSSLDHIKMVVQPPEWDSVEREQP